jgi:hypothetical protein
VRFLASLLLFALLQAPLPSSAASHLWRFSELYSSPDRSIQFIEMQEVGGSAIEWGIGNHWYRTNTYNLDLSDLLGSNLPNVSTANKKFLVGSESYAALPGVPPPDYTIPDGAIDPSGDTVMWWFYQTIAIPPQTMPSDGLRSLYITNPQESNPAPIFAIAFNSPTNFAGQTGMVVISQAVPAASPPWLGLLGVGVAALGLFVLARQQRA